jgi:hypothetical protein
LPGAHLPWSVHLVPREPGPIQEVRWEPESSWPNELDWHDLTTQFDLAVEAMATHPWIVSWMEPDSDRRIVLSLGGEHLEQLGPCWAHAGLPGAPEFELWLSEPSQFRAFRLSASLALAFDAPGFIVTQSGPARGFLTELGMPNSNVHASGVYARILGDSPPEVRRVGD